MRVHRPCPRARPRAIGMRCRWGIQPRHWASALLAGPILAHVPRCSSYDWIRGTGPDLGPPTPAPHARATAAGTHPAWAPPSLHAPHSTPPPAPQILTIAGSVAAGTLVVAAAVAFGATHAPRKERKEDKKNAISKALAASTSKKAQAPKVKSGGCPPLSVNSLEDSAFTSNWAGLEEERHSDGTARICGVLKSQDASGVRGIYSV